MIRSETTYDRARLIVEVRRLAARGNGVLLSTHDPDHAFAVASTVELMREGAILAAGPPHDVLTAGRLRDVDGVEVTIEGLPDGRVVCLPKW